LICNFGQRDLILDYYATGKLNPKDAKKIISSISRGCREAECALVGGETAEMPGMYNVGDFDLAGFAVGIAEKSQIERVHRIRDGQALFGSSK